MGDIISYFQHHPGRFVTQGQRFSDKDIPIAVMVVIMEIRPAKSCCLYGQLELICCHFGNFPLLL